MRTGNRFQSLEYIGRSTVWSRDVRVPFSVFAVQLDPSFHCACLSADTGIVTSFFARDAQRGPNVCGRHTQQQIIVRRPSRFARRSRCSTPRTTMAFTFDFYASRPPFASAPVASELTPSKLILSYAQTANALRSRGGYTRRVPSPTVSYLHFQTTVKHHNANREHNTNQQSPRESQLRAHSRH